MRLNHLALLPCLALAACGPSAYEQAQRTQQLAKCGAYETFDQECAAAYELIRGPGEGVKEKHRLLVTSYKYNMRDWGSPELRVVPGPDVGGGSADKSPSAYEQKRRKADQAKCKQGASFDQECVDAFDAFYQPGAGVQQRKLLLERDANPSR